MKKFIVPFTFIVSLSAADLPNQDFHESDFHGTDSLGQLDFTSDQDVRNNNYDVTSSTIDSDTDYFPSATEDSDTNYLPTSGTSQRKSSKKLKIKPLKKVKKTIVKPSTPTTPTTERLTPEQHTQLVQGIIKVTRELAYTVSYSGLTKIYVPQCGSK